MTNDNAAKTPPSFKANHSGIHLAYSRAWRQNQPASAPTPPQPAPVPVHKGKPVGRVTLAAAAVIAPIVWAGHALLQRLHLR